MPPNPLTGEPTRRELSEQIAGFTVTLEANRNKIIEQEVELNKWRTAGRITEFALAALRAVVASGTIYIDAEAEAQAIVKRWLLDTESAHRTNTLIHTKRAKYEEEFGEEWAEELERDLDIQYEENGRYADLRQEIEDEKTAIVSDDLIAKKRAEIEAELDEPESVEARVADEVKRLIDTGVYANMLAKAEKARRSDVEAAAIKRAKTDIDKEVAAGEEAAIKRAKKDWRESWDGRDYAAAAKGKAEKRWNKDGQEQAARELDDQEWLDLITAKRDREKARLVEEALFAEHLALFDKAGIDTTKLPVDTQMTLYLGGDVQTVTVREIPKGYSYEQEVKKKQLVCERILKLTSIGEGHFVVDDDTLLRAVDKYRRNDALAAGTTIRIGRLRRKRENGTQLPDELDTRVARNVHLWIDDDSSDTAPLIDANYGVSNVSMNGVSARKDYDLIKMPEGSR